MTWFERRLAKLEEHRQRKALIKQHAPGIYEDLWGEIIVIVSEAKAKGWQVDTNGEPRKRVVLLQKQAKSTDWRLEVSLVDGKDRIRAKSDRGQDFYIDLEICPDGVVCLMLDGDQITIEEAAIAILDPFLFRELREASS